MVSCLTEPRCRNCRGERGGLVLRGATRGSHRHLRLVAGGDGLPGQGTESRAAAEVHTAEVHTRMPRSPTVGVPHSQGANVYQKNMSFLILATRHLTPGWQPHRPRTPHLRGSTLL